MKIRKGKESDITRVQNLIVKTFRKKNYGEGTKKAVQDYLDWHDPKKNLKKLKEFFKNRTFYFVVEENRRIIGVIKGRENKIGNLFVDPKYHGKGIARKLVEKLEKEAIKKGSKEIKIKSSIYAVLFYQKMGYKKTTGVKSMEGLKYQPMRKKL